MAKPNSKRTRPRRKRSAGRKAIKQAAPPKVRAARGEIGPRTYEAVRKIVEEKKLPVGKAFEEVAKATGRQPGTVAVTYYRIAKRKGGPTRKRRGGKTAGRPPGRRADAAGAGIKAILSRVSAAIGELENVIARQAREIDRLRGESRLAERIRQALRD